MKLVVCEPDNIPPWIFPEALPDYPDPGMGVDIPALDDPDFVALAKAIGVSLAGDPLDWQSSGCSVGFPHDAPDFVPCIRPEILEALAAIPHQERWRVAERWAEQRLKKRPSKEELSLHKSLVKTLCEYAAVAVEKGHVAVLLAFDE
jgi:hypothetical protein